MPALNSRLRSDLDGVCQKARDLAEAAARSALQKRAVDAAEPFPHFTTEDRDLRNRLRARGRQLGDVRSANKSQSIDQLTQELAYEYWHRMLFARFLAENHLLMHPDGVAVSLAECDELAASEGTANGFDLAARYASKMLPQIFRTDDVLLEIEFPVNDRLPLEKLLNSLPGEVFTADDSLGWVYQFWQSKKKDEVNRSGQKIDGRTLPAVTQLFTEPYMVNFLLHNTLGAWWAGRKLTAEDAENAETEKELRRKLALPGVDWEYLRFVRDESDKTKPPPDSSSATSASSAVKSSGLWRPAAGTFDGWPKSLKEFKLLDPCCGSGHFLVAAFNLLVPLRMHDEGLSAREACDAVLRENLFGLELDPRCTQIAAFALAVAAWKHVDLPSPAGTGRGKGDRHLLCEAPEGPFRQKVPVPFSPGGEGQPLGYRQLPPLNIACTGIGPQATEEEWLRLAEQSGRPMSVLSREPILNGLRNLYALFSSAPTLGSLIDPNQLPADLITADYETLQPYLAAALTAEQTDDDAHERAVAAAGMVKAAELLAGEYTLVATNVPYLGRGKQDDTLSRHLEKHYSEGKADLATAFVVRCLEFCVPGGSVALVTPQNWLFLSSYTKFRQLLLKVRTWNAVVRLGEHAFESSAAAGAFAAMLVFSATVPSGAAMMAGMDVSEPKQAAKKAAVILTAPVLRATQAAQLENANARVVLAEPSDLPLLEEYADSFLGLGTGDFPHYGRCFWEFDAAPEGWTLEQASVEETVPFGGREHVLAWDNKTNRVRGMSNSEREQIHNQDQSGQQAWGRPGVAISLMRTLRATFYTGEQYEKALTVLSPKNPRFLPALWAYCSSTQLNADVRKLDQKIIVANGTVTQVPFDLTYWQQVAAEKYPNGLPEPESDDPTQWLFHGRPEQSTAPLQVAVARLLGYRWPAELEGPHPNPLPEAEGTGMRLSARARELVQTCDALVPLADKDGIVCIPSVRGEEPAAGRLLEVLRAAYGGEWSEARLHDLLAESGCKPGTTLDDWLRSAFFEQHCKLFHNRPFIWHIWDGRKDGFACLVNYHKLNDKALENLAYSYLGDWIKAQNADAKAGKVGADLRLAAAEALQEKLKLILAGEPPYDIFVRWKPIEEQPIGWNPDLNDGVRMNIRPFVTAGVLRKNPNIKWTKDRGKDPETAPWFKVFKGERINDHHLTLGEKQAARSKQEVK